MIERRYADGAHWQVLAGYSRAVRSGSHISVSGTTASLPDGSPATGGTGEDRSADTYLQAIDALRRGVDAVEQLGGAVVDVVRTRIYLVPGADWRAAARAHREVFDAVRPANTMLYVTALVGDDLLVEVEMDAQVGGAGDGASDAGTTGTGAPQAAGASTTEVRANAGGRPGSPGDGSEVDR